MTNLASSGSKPLPTKVCLLSDSCSVSPFFLALLEKGKSALIVHLGVVQGACNSEIVGSKFQDRMFIKLSSNRKILREAVKNASWPKGGKLNNQQVDTGMQLFWELVSLIKTNQNPSKGFLLLMESLSTSSSTLGLTQKKDCLPKFCNF